MIQMCLIFWFMFRDEVVHLLAFELREEDLKHELDHSCFQRYAHFDILFIVNIYRKTLFCCA